MDKVIGVGSNVEIESVDLENKYVGLRDKAIKFGLSPYYVFNMGDYSEYKRKNPDWGPDNYEGYLENCGEELRNPLEGAVCIHGFQSNLKFSEKSSHGINQESTLRKVIKSGAIVSINQRELNSAEVERGREANFDQERICVEARSGNKNDGEAGAYIGSYFWAAPVEVLAGKKVTEDPANGKQSISVYKEGGVKIELEQGIVFLPLDLLLKVVDDLAERAEKLGINTGEYLNRYVRIIPDSVEIHDKKELWELVTQTITPAKKVDFQPMPLMAIETKQNKLRSNSFIDVVRQEEEVSKSQLGKSEIIASNLFENKAVMKDLEMLYQNSFNNLSEFLGTLTKDNKALEAYPLIDADKILKIRNLLELTSPNNPLIPRFDHIIEFNKRLEAYDQKRLGILFPNVGSEWRRVGEKILYKDKRGKYRVSDRRRPGVDDV